MTDVIEFKWEGGDELVAKLEKLVDAMGRKELNDRAAMAGGEVLRSEAERLAPGPHIVKELTMSFLSGSEVQVGPDKKHWYYQFFETGATAHEIGPKNKQALLLEGGDIVALVRNQPGMPAKPFLRPAIDTKQEQAENAVGKVYELEINKLAEAQ